ncbi:hypothetical protein [Streptomyces microflavus]|uniref:hypothetical protein n=1 Tax=Streptomyces microflavus TaxID=1919 RepID=UPI0033BA9D9B
MPGATDGRGHRTEKADCTLASQPCCNTIATPPVCTLTGTSDHVPVYGSTQGGPDLDWRMNGTASGGSLGLTGTPSPGAPWSTGRGGALELDGVSGAMATPGPVVDARRSFTVSAWAKADPEAGISAVRTRLTWVHDAVARTITLYVDGAPVGTVAHTATWAGNGSDPGWPGIAVPRRTLP